VLPSISLRNGITVEESLKSVVSSIRELSSALKVLVTSLALVYWA